MYQLCKEPDARKPHVRICGGQVSQGACLPDTVGFDGVSIPCQVRRFLSYKEEITRRQFE